MDLVNIFNNSSKTEVLGIGEWVVSHQLQEKIAQGSFGPVHLGKSRKRYSVVKQVERHLYADKCPNEHELLQLVKNNMISFVVKYYGCSVILNQVCLITKYCPGGDLKSITVKKYNGKMPENILKFYTQEMIVGLREMHKYGYLHLDIKPENILVDKYGHTVISDFGCAVTKDLKTEEETKHGVSLSESLDWWSLGVLWLELAGGEVIKEHPQIGRGYMCGKLLIPCPHNVLTNCTPLARDFVKDILSGNYMMLKKASVKKHKYFKLTNWNKVKVRSTTPPFVPAFTLPTR